MLALTGVSRCSSVADTNQRNLSCGENAEDRYRLCAGYAADIGAKMNLELFKYDRIRLEELVKLEVCVEKSK